jgi:DNA-binding NarL/FixJ family response regulator
MRESIVPLDILIVDDHQIMVDGLTGILKGEKKIGNIYTALDGKEACKVAFNNNIDCMIVDINMPNLNGIEAIELIKKEKPHLKIIVISMITEPSIVRRALKAGADAFVVKNAGKETLMKAITKVMNNEKYLSEELSYNLFNAPKRVEKTEGVHITEREKQIIKHISEGLTNHEIAKKLFISQRTVDTHRKNILNKLELRNTAALIKYAAENHLI